MAAQACRHLTPKAPAPHAHLLVFADAAVAQQLLHAGRVTRGARRHQRFQLRRKPHRHLANANAHCATAAAPHAAAARAALPPERRPRRRPGRAANRGNAAARAAVVLRCERCRQAYVHTWCMLFACSRGRPGMRAGRHPCSVDDLLHNIVGVHQQQSAQRHLRPIPQSPVERTEPVQACKCTCMHECGALQSVTHACAHTCKSLRP
eukprot:289796-Chlamydomonas_euryale.AAC.1